MRRCRSGISLSQGRIPPDHLLEISCRTRMPSKSFKIENYLPSICYQAPSTSPRPLHTNEISPPFSLLPRLVPSSSLVLPRRARDGYARNPPPLYLLFVLSPRLRPTRIASSSRSTVFTVRSRLPPMESIAPKSISFNVTWTECCLVV